MISSAKEAAVAIADKKDERAPSLVNDLASYDAVVRTRARRALAGMGKLAVPSLILLLSHAKPHVRWEAAKTLCSIADPIAASALVNALDDHDGDVRWLASEGLAALGRDALQPLLAALLQQSDSIYVLEGARHVCHELAKKRRLAPILRPVLAAMRQSQPEVAVPLAAYAALSKLRSL